MYGLFISGLILYVGSAADYWNYSVIFFKNNDVRAPISHHHPPVDSGLTGAFLSVPQ